MVTCHKYCLTFSCHYWRNCFCWWTCILQAAVWLWEYLKSRVLLGHDVLLSFSCVFQMGQTRWWEQEISIGGTIQKGQLLTYNLTELIKPDSYLVRLTPITRYGEGDAAERIITYSGALFSYTFTTLTLLTMKIFLCLTCHFFHSVFCSSQAFRNQENFTQFVIKYE